MNKTEKFNWLKKKGGNLFISEEFYHHHAFEIINSNPKVSKAFSSGLNKKINISTRIKMTKSVPSKGIKADDLNKEIRFLLNNLTSLSLKFEVVERAGVFYFSGGKNAIGGFDFAVINHEQNLYALRNICFGELQYADGQKRWDSFLKKNPKLGTLAKSIQKKGINGKNLDYKKSKESPLIVGEIQFGNWALAYRDFFKVLKANVQNSVDCLIYLVPTGNLESMLSDGIVTFEKSKKIITDFEKVISVPIWLIGIDIKI